MSDLDRFRALMLEHLYGLLDADEARQLEEYLDTPDGADLRAEAEVWKSQLAGASRLEFPATKFVPPVPAPATPVVRPAAAPPATIRSIWARWGVAAAILLVFAGLGGPAAYQFFGWYAQSHQVRNLEVALQAERHELRRAEDQLRNRRDEIRQEHERAVASQKQAEIAYRDARTAAQKAIEQKDFLVRLSGPERVQPGAPNEWQIETVTPQGAPASPARMELVVRDDQNTVLLKETREKTKGKSVLTLPRSVWDRVKPGAELFLEIVAFADDNRRGMLAERIPLARPVFVTHLVTDKPIYQPGEKVRFRSLTLDRATFQPPAHDLQLQFRLKNPDGAMIPVDEGNGRLVHGMEPVLGPDQKPLRGIGTGEYELPEDSPGGEYTLELVEIQGQNASETLLDSRRFLVNRYTIPKLQKRLDFDGKSYGPGDVVQARLEVTRSDRSLTDARADFEVRVGEGTPIHVEKAVALEIIRDPATREPVKAVGTVRFKLPADLFTNRPDKDQPIEATVAVRVQDGTTSESIVRPVALTDTGLTVEFFPEGGDLVEGVPGRVYFQVRTAAGKPGDLRGTITDGAETITEVSTVTDAQHPGVNRGLGVFQFTPKAGKKYFLKLRSPAGIPQPTANGFPLPVARTDGVVLTALDEVTGQGNAIRIRLQVAKGPKTLHVGAYARGKLIGHQSVQVTAGTPVETKLNGNESLGGVTRITVFEETGAADARRPDLVPRAERLVYRRPGERLNVTVTPNRGHYSPRDGVALELKATDEKGHPAAAVLLVAVVNQSVLALGANNADRLLPTHFLLAGEVKHPSELEHADFLLTDHPRAALALDLLLGTQGWRRFAEQNVPQGDPANREHVERMLVSHGQRSSVPLELRRLEEQRLAAEFMPRLTEAGLRVVDAQAALDEYRRTEEPGDQQRVSLARSRVEGAEHQHLLAAAELYRFETRAVRMRSWALPLLLVGMIVLGAVGAAIALHRRTGERRPYVLSAAGSLAAAALIFWAVIITRGTPETSRAHARIDAISKQTAAAKPKASQGGALGPATKDQGTEDFRPASATAKVGVPPMFADAPIELSGDPRSVRPLIASKDSSEEGSDRTEKNRQRLRDLLAAARIASGAAVAGPHRASPPKAVDDPAATAASVPFVVREYAHQRKVTAEPNGGDHTETVYWHPVLVLPGSGQMVIQFNLTDDTGKYQVLVAGHTVSGRIGATTKIIEVIKP